MVPPSTGWTTPAAIPSQLYQYVVSGQFIQQRLGLLRQFPYKVDVEDLIYRLHLREKLAAAEADIAAGRTLSAEEVRENALEWRQ